MDVGVMMNGYQMCILGVSVIYFRNFEGCHLGGWSVSELD